NPPLANYLPMAAECAKRGFYALRMGELVGEPLPAGLHPNIIDYASKFRAPFGDVYLLGTCKFVVAGGSGLYWIAGAFNRPAVWTDSYPLEMRPLRPVDLFIPKKLWVISEKRFLSFREMIESGMRYYYESKCRSDGIELIHNTPEEICAVVEETCRRLDGTWVSGREDEELQRRFDALYLPKHSGYGMPGRIGAQFLRDHKGLLEG
ncbi:MAG: TIGR04372 family glycosyltransferase, partial [Deltaproteobacteria bacterium]|nr:TIGR04372 family glycosyltransferase [Deltaproteobacteria bacterium]